jgi:hypothetical protein
LSPIQYYSYTISSLRGLGVGTNKGLKDGLSSYESTNTLLLFTCIGGYSDLCKGKNGEQFRYKSCLSKSTSIKTKRNPYESYDKVQFTPHVKNLKLAHCIENILLYSGP